jgi:hypothetical protein
MGAVWQGSESSRWPPEERMSDQRGAVREGSGQWVGGGGPPVDHRRGRVCELRIRRVKNGMRWAVWAVDSRAGDGGRLVDYIRQGKQMGWAGLSWLNSWRSCGRRDTTRRTT